MLERFQYELRENFPFLYGKKLLLAISGGVDSMVLWHLFQKNAFQLGIAHCNFQLRGAESLEDQQFVENMAKQENIPCHTILFDTDTFADDFHMSVQMAARTLRYNWFYEIYEKERYDYIITAHHADDNLETFMINLSRGTGLEGLAGIPKVNGKVIRPLLSFSRAEIVSYAEQNKISWREDSSNVSTKYLRNRIRKELIPILKEINPDILASFQKTQSHLQEAVQMVEDAAILVYRQVAEEKEGAIHFDLKKLQQLPNFRSYLYHWLKDYGFSDWEAIGDLAVSQSGKQIFGNSCRLLKDREALIIYPNPDPSVEEFRIDQGQTEVKFPLNMSFRRVADILTTSNSSIFVDEDKLSFPLQIRKWRKGDRFQPIGMNGQSKKVSKLFKDEKLSLCEKERVWLLCSRDQIVWVIGLRADERFKVADSTRQILNISIHT